MRSTMVVKMDFGEAPREVFKAMKPSIKSSKDTTVSTPKESEKTLKFEISAEKLSNLRGCVNSIFRLFRVSSEALEVLK